MASSLDLTGAAVGAWDIVIINPDTNTAILPGAFNVQAPLGPDLWSFVVGRTAIRPGVPVRYTIVYGNKENVEAYDVPLTLSTPGNFVTRLYFGITPPPAQPGQVATDWTIAPVAVWPYALDRALTVPFLIPIVPAGFSGTLDFDLLLPRTAAHGDTFTFSAILGVPLLATAPDPWRFSEWLTVQSNMRKI